MSKITSIALLCMIVLIASCSSANRASIYRKFTVDNPGGISIDAHQRTIIASTKLDEHKNPRTIFCAEPSPDAFSNLTSSVALNVDLIKHIEKLPVINDLLSTSASDALSERTATIQLLRDGLYRACEAYASGALSDVEYVGALRQYQRMTLALLSIELLTTNLTSKSIDSGSGAEDQENVGSENESDPIPAKLSEKSIETITTATVDIIDQVLRRGAASKHTQITRCLEILRAGGEKIEKEVRDVCLDIIREEYEVPDSDSSILEGLNSLLEFNSDEQALVPKDAENIDVDRTKDVQFEQGTYSKWLTFDIAESGMWRISVQGDTFGSVDPAFKVYGASDNDGYLDELGRDDDSGSGLGARMDIELGAGRYWVNVYDVSGSGGRSSVLVTSISN